MNFIFLNECEMDDLRMRHAYEVIFKELEHAEELYWRAPQECGIILRGVAEQICQVYNDRYEVGFEPRAALEEFLCYADDERHDVMVSRFLSVVRKEQRDRLNRLRVLGDECIKGVEAMNPDMDYEEWLAAHAKRMMETVFDALKDMCEKINGREDMKGIRFSEEALPVKPCPKEVPQPSNKSAFARFFKGREKN